MDDIEKLKVRVERDPNSRLFLPLAEEYRKAGMLDEAISVLLRGLERHHNYTSARVALGRIYLEKNMIEDARREFEKVITAIPDNLFAHKKLAEIYRDIGDIDRAIEEYKTVIEINPLDEDARLFIEGREGVEKRGLPEDIETIAEPLLAETLEELSKQEQPLELPPEPKELPKETPFLSGESPIKATAKEESEEEFFGIPEDQVFDLTGEELGEVLPEDMMDVKSPSSEVEEPEETISEETIEPLHEPEVTETGIYEESLQFEGLELSDEDKLDFTEADGLVLKGEYFKAFDSYKTMLKEYPDNRKVLQRIAELKGLIKILGKDEEIVLKLEAFLEGIRRRRDEFFGRS